MMIILTRSLAPKAFVTTKIGFDHYYFLLNKARNFFSGFLNTCYSLEDGSLKMRHLYTVAAGYLFILIEALFKIAEVF